MTGTAALAMNDSQAAPVVTGGFSEECRKRMARLFLGHAMEIDFIANRVVAAPQALQHRFRHVFAAPDEFFAGFDVELGCIECERVREDARLVGAARGGARTTALARRQRLRMAERPHVAHGRAEQFAFVVLDD